MALKGFKICLLCGIRISDGSFKMRLLFAIRDTEERTGKKIASFSTVKETSQR